MTKSKIPTADLAKALGINFSCSDLVNIDGQRLGLLCEDLSRRSDFRDYKPYAWDETRLWKLSRSKAEQSQYFAVGNAINYRYWDKRGDSVFQLGGSKGGEEYHGAVFMWRCLRVAVESRGHPIIDAAYISEITDEQFDVIFCTDDGLHPLDVGKQDRLRNLRDLGSKLLEHFGGSFFNLVGESDGSLEKFARLCRQFRAYDDPLYKLTMVNAILHSGSGVAEFDAEPLPGIDYQLVKQLLRMGILLPSDHVAEKLRRQDLLDAQEAGELRRVALLAFIQISSETGISGEILDNKWWLNRVKCLDDKPVCLNPLRAKECPFYGSCRQLIDYTKPLEITRYY